MRSKGSRFTLGVWGLRVCSLDVVRLRPQPSAAVRNRPQPSATVRKRRVASFHVAGVALRDIQTCFVLCRESFCVAGAILLRRFQKMRCSFRGRRSILDVRSTLNVSCCVAFANRIGGAAPVATRCRFRGRRGIL